MIKLLLTLLMMFAFGTSTVNAEENTTSIKDRISELTETSSDSESAIKAEVDELSEDELKAIIENVNEMTEPTEVDLAIKEAAISRIEELNPLTIVVGVLAFCFVLLYALLSIYYWS